LRKYGNLTISVRNGKMKSLETYFDVPIRQSDMLCWLQWPGPENRLFPCECEKALSSGCLLLVLGFDLSGGPQQCPGKEASFKLLFSSSLAHFKVGIHFNT